MLRSLLLASTVVVCALAAVAPPAQAQKAPKEVTVDATFQFDYTTTWKQPASWSNANCARRVWSEGAGEESYHLKSRKPVRMIFRVLDGNGAISPITVDGAPQRMLVSLSGPQNRRRTGRVWHEAVGECSFTPFEQRFSGDCGTRLPAMEVLFAWDGRELRSQMGGDQTVEQRDRDQQRFERCDMLYPKGSPGGAWNLKPRKLAIADVLGKATFHAGDSQTWSESNERYTGSSTLTWKATFARVGKVTTVGGDMGKPVARPKQPKRKIEVRGKGRRRKG